MVIRFEPITGSDVPERRQGQLSWAPSACYLRVGLGNS